MFNNQRVTRIFSYVPLSKLSIKQFFLEGRGVDHAFYYDNTFNSNM